MKPAPSLLPAELSRDATLLKAEYKCLENRKFMVVLTDVTEERRLEASSKANNVARKIASVSRNSCQFRKCRIRIFSMHNHLIATNIIDYSVDKWSVGNITLIKYRFFSVPIVVRGNNDASEKIHSYNNRIRSQIEQTILPYILIRSRHQKIYFCTKNSASFSDSKPYSCKYHFLHIIQLIFIFALLVLAPFFRKNNCLCVADFHVWTTTKIYKIIYYFDVF